MASEFLPKAYSLFQVLNTLIMHRYTSRLYMCHFFLHSLLFTYIANISYDSYLSFLVCTAAPSYFREFFPADEDSGIHNCLCFSLNLSFLERL